jgi:ATP-dependent DNA helicase RecG
LGSGPLFRTEEFGTKSVARNPLIASLLHRIDYIEKIGTGINRIKQAVATHGGTELDIRYNDFFTIIFRVKAAALNAQAAVKGLAASSEKGSEKILRLLAGNPNLTISELAEQLVISTRAVEKNIRKLQDNGRLQRIGPAKGGHWQVLEGTDE